MIAKFGEEVAAEPEDLEGALRRMVAGVRALFGLGVVELSATIGESRRISVADGSPGAVGSADGSAAEFPILRGRIPVGVLRAYPAKRGRKPPGVVPLDAKRREGLRAVAAAAALALNAAYMRELAARRAAYGNAVQIASEALGDILDERELYETVLVLTMELLGASGGAVLLEDGDTVSFGLEGDEETLTALGRVTLKGRSPWIGRLDGNHALGVKLGRGSGAVFLVRKTRPYTEAEGVSLKLVARQLTRARERSRLYASLEQTTMNVIAALAATLESRNSTTGGHIKRTRFLAREVARKLGLSSEEVREVQYAAALHDIGKIGIPDSILNKPAGLDEEEWRIMHRHPRIGADIVRRIAGFEGVAEVVLAHHERYDGRGYPAGLAGSEIPIGARLISVIDAYDAMTNDRPYHKALTHEHAVAELQANSGSQFDPEVVEALKAVLLERGEAEEEKEPRS